MIINPSQFNKIEIPYNKITARLGYIHGKTKIDSVTEELILDEIKNAYTLINPKQVISFAEIKILDNNIILDNEFLIVSAYVSQLLKNCHTAYGFAVTIGNNLEDKRNLYIKEKKHAKAVILDAIGSAAVEEFANITHIQINEEMKEKNMLTTKRFSPGYGDWGLSEQKHLLNWLGASNIGIKLTENFQMIPEKSVSAILGVKTNE